MTSLHIRDDPACAFIDWSRRHAEQLANLTPQVVQAMDMPQVDKEFHLFRLLAVRKRQQWELTHPNGPRFPGVFLRGTE